MRVLALNLGSSSVKFAAYPDCEAEPVFSGSFSGVGKPRGSWRLRVAGRVVEEEETAVADPRAAVRRVLGLVGRFGDAARPEVIGHRIVHGGPHHDSHGRIDDGFRAELGRVRTWAPNHLDAQIAAIEVATAEYPGILHVACVDTAFHRNLPEPARMLPIPRRYWDKGVRRYGFHGISYEYLLSELRRQAGDGIADDRTIFAHLGNGASLAAVHRGRCVDTTMGFTPAAGLMMSSRAGDFDPGLAAYLQREEKLDADGFDRLVNRESGLLGVSGRSADVRELLAAEKEDPQAALALDMFCHVARKGIGAMAASMGGVRTLVFSGGIGENSAPIRERICANLGFLAGLEVRVIPTDEERQIARIACRIAGPVDK